MHFPALIQDLAVILGVAAVVTFVFRLIRQPVVLGYIIAGVIVGPHTPAVFSVSDTANIKVWAELGVVFLMFGLGLEFSFRRLTKVGVSAGITATIQIVAMMGLGIVAGNALGFTKMDAVFIGCMISISSTTIIIKALEELKLNTKRFAELVYGILIVEDLAAILMLVALTNIATRSEVSAMDLLLAGGRLSIVVAVWFVVGMFLVPKLVRLVSKVGDDEMLTVVATSLCLLLVALAANFHYSVALGAFIMGSILAESSEVKRIEHLVRPLKDIFGAVFFVSVGMLLDPISMASHWHTIAILSSIIIVGKLATVIFGAFATGQTMRTAVQTGFSMAQIGEFSFIIASLGLAYEVISPSIYPVIVATSIVTTFTTPYLIRFAVPFAETLEQNLPARIKSIMGNYVAWVQRRTLTNERRKAATRGIIKWLLNAVLVIAIFTIGATRLVPVAEKYALSKSVAISAAWFVCFMMSTPSIWAMMNAFREFGAIGRPKRRISVANARITSSIMTIGLLGLVSAEFFPAFETLLVTLGICSLFLILFRRRIGTYYRWLELQFRSEFRADLGVSNRENVIKRLAPWDAHLVEVKVPATSSIVGKTLHSLNLREHYGLNIVVISRDEIDLIAPKASEILYPGDKLLCFATDAQIDRFKTDIAGSKAAHRRALETSEAYELKRFRVNGESTLNGSSIRTSGVRERYDCMVVGLERGSERIISPVSTHKLIEGDVLWIVGDEIKLRELANLFEK
jgi:CPA2 family monovalent cation:H+ antiporter-2